MLQSQRVIFAFQKPARIQLYVFKASSYLQRVTIRSGTFMYAQRRKIMRREAFDIMSKKTCVKY